MSDRQLPIAKFDGETVTARSSEDLLDVRMVTLDDAMVNVLFPIAERHAAENGFASFEDFTADMLACCRVLWADEMRRKHAYIKRVDQRLREIKRSREFEHRNASINKGNARFMNSLTGGK